RILHQREAQLLGGAVDVAAAECGLRLGDHAGEAPFGVDRRESRQRARLGRIQPERAPIKLARLVALAGEPQLIGGAGQAVGRALARPQQVDAIHVIVRLEAGGGVQPGYALLELPGLHQFQAFAVHLLAGGAAGGDEHRAQGGAAPHFLSPTSSVCLIASGRYSSSSWSAAAASRRYSSLIASPSLTMCTFSASAR